MELPSSDIYVDAILATLRRRPDRDLSFKKTHVVVNRWLEERGEVPIPGRSLRLLLEDAGIEIFEAPYGDALRGIDIQTAVYLRLMR
ncbi:hypothetical protein OH779_22360 [Actinacidiphila glaucinigra]|uniref:hypothetical protein n=1 Tax=Actinacidiphila glaucinigra TaxID=235986 RepID=UPI0038647803